MNIEKVRFDSEKFSSFVKSKFFNDMTEQMKVISLTDIQKKTGISKSTLSRIMNGKKPDIDTFFTLCNWMNTDANSFKLTHKK